MAGETEAIFDDAEVQKFLDGLKRKGKSLEQGSRALAGIISSNVYRDIMAHFDQEQGPGGAQWAAWSSVYAEHMDKKGRGGNKILQDSGRLRQSVTPTNYRVLPGGIVFYNPAKTKDGFPYAQAHDEGGGKLPQRQFMYLSEIAMEEIAEQTLKWLLDDA